jgi:hypothetical protein
VVIGGMDGGVDEMVVCFMMNLRCQRAVVDGWRGLGDINQKIRILPNKTTLIF